MKQINEHRVVRLMLTQYLLVIISPLTVEGSKLNSDELDFTAKLLRVHAKGKKERLLPISIRDCEWLAFYIGKIRPMFAFIGSGKALFLANNGKRYIPGKLSDMASQNVKSVGFDLNGAYYLYRHNTATTVVDNGADLRHIKEMLGHASILTTQLYTHVSRKKLTEVCKATHPSAEGGNGLF